MQVYFININCGFSAKAILIKKGARCRGTTTYLGRVADVQECVKKIKARPGERDMFDIKDSDGIYRCYVYKLINYPCNDLMTSSSCDLYRIV